MSDLDVIVEVSISRETTAPSQAGFGTPLLVGYHTAYLDRRVATYSEPSEMLDDGFTESDELYQKALVVKSQDPSPTQFKVGRCTNLPTRVVHLIPTITTEGHVYKGDIAGNEFSYTVGAGATVDSIVTAIQPIVDAYSEVSATDDTTQVTVTDASPGTGFKVSFDAKNGMHLLDATADPGIVADLNAIAAEDDDWYGVALTDQSEAIVLAAAVLIESLDKIMIPETADWDSADASEVDDLATALVNLSYANTALIWHHEIGGHAGAAFMSTILAEDNPVGSATPAFKQLTGVPVSNLSTGRQTAINNKNATYYVRRGGLNTTFEGKTPLGDYIDVTRLIHWTKARMQERVFGALATPKKVPFTDAGADIVRTAMQSVLTQGIRNLGIRPGTDIITIPAVKDVPVADRANRTLPDCDFEYEVAGAIHRTKVKGRVKV